LVCDCNDDKFHGVPCRHQMALALKVSNFPLKLLPFAKRWRIDYYKEKNQHKEPEVLPELEVLLFILNFYILIGKEK